MFEQILQELIFFGCLVLLLGVVCGGILLLIIDALWRIV